MSDIITPLFPEYTLNIPDQAISLIGWGLWLVILVFLVIRGRDHSFKLNHRNLLWLAFLSLCILVFTPFFGVGIGNQNIEIPGARPISHLMFLAALPWMLAGGILGLIPSVLLAALSGFFLAYLDTHHFFTPLLFMSVAYIYYRLSSQSNRVGFTRIYRLPLIAAMVSLLLSMPLILLAQLLSISGNFEQRILYALAAYQPTLFAFGGMLFVSGVLCTLIKVFAPKLWLKNAAPKNKTGEINIRARWLSTIIPVLTLLWVGASIVSWKIVEQRQRKGIIDQFTTTSIVVAEDLTALIKTSRGLLEQKAEQAQGSFFTQPGFAEAFREDATFNAIFESVLMIDLEGKVKASYPRVTKQAMDQIEEKTSLITNISPEQMNRGYITGVETENGSIRMVLLVKINHPEAPGELVLWGEIDHSSNILISSSLGLLESFAENAAYGEIITADGINLYSTALDRSNSILSNVFYATPTYIEKIAVNGQQFMQYFYPVTDTDLAVVLSYPADQLNISVLRAIYPLLWGGLILLLASIMLTFVGWSLIDKTLNQLHRALQSISAGDLNFEIKRSKHKLKLTPNSEDLFVMVDAIKERTRHQNQIFSINKATTGSLDLEGSLNILMRAALSQGVSSVRIVIMNGSNGKDSNQPGKRFAMGKHAQDLEALDEEILATVLNKGVFVYRDFQVGKEIKLTKGMPYPASLIAVPLTSQGKKIGVLWVTYQDLRSPNNGDIEYFKELAGRTSALIENNRVFTKATHVRSQLEAVLDVLPDAIFLFDGNGNIIYQNHTAVILFREQAPHTFDDIDQHMRKFGIKTLLAPDDGSLVTYEVELQKGFTYHVFQNPIVFDNLNHGKILVFSNITEQKARDSRKSEYVETVSHELRTPLTLIQGYAKILRLTGNLNEQQNDYLNNIIHGVEEMQHLVQNLLDIGRLESGAPLDISSFNVADIMRKVVETAAVQAKQNNIQLQWLEPEAIIKVEADVTLVTQALKNLVDNGIKFTKMGGEVILSVSSHENDVIFAVKDTGIGISPLDQRHLFEKFHKITPNAGEKPSGSGLGLAIVKFIAERHNGKVWLESQLGQGSTFYFQIPQGEHQ